MRASEAIRHKAIQKAKFHEIRNRALANKEFGRELVGIFMVEHEESPRWTIESCSIEDAEIRVRYGAREHWDFLDLVNALYEKIGEEHKVNGKTKLAAALVDIPGRTPVLRNDNTKKQYERLTGIKTNDRFEHMWYFIHDGKPEWIPATA